MKCFTYLRNVTDSLSDGKTPYERRFGQPFKGPVIPFGSLVEYHPITAKDQSRIHQFGEKVLLGLFLGNDGRARNHLRGLIEGNKRWKCNYQMVPLLTDTRGLLLRANTVARFIVMITAMWMEKCNDWFVTSIWHNVRLRQVGNRWLWSFTTFSMPWQVL